MPDYLDDNDLREDTDDTNDTEDSADGDEPKASPPAGDDKSEKRIKDLQSKADKAEARANRLQKMLEAVSGEGSGSEDVAPVAGKPPVLDASALMTLELFRELTFQQDPKLAEAGYTASDLTGYTAAEVRASAASLTRKSAEQETRIRNKVLAEHGLAPEIVGSNHRPEPDRDFSKMASKDFNELMERVMKG